MKMHVEDKLLFLDCIGSIGPSGLIFGDVLSLSFVMNVNAVASAI